jgi:hypothetical protein
VADPQYANPPAVSLEAPMAAPPTVAPPAALMPSREPMPAPMPGEAPAPELVAPDARSMREPLPLGDASTYRGAAGEVQRSAEEARSSFDRQSAVYDVTSRERRAAQGEFAAEQQELLRAQQERTRLYQEERRQLLTDYDRINREIAEDARKVGDSRTDKQKILGIVAIALASIGDAVGALGGYQSDGSTRVAEGISRAVQADVDRQWKALEKKGELAKATRDRIGQVRDFFGDDMQAQALVGAITKDRYASQVESIADTMGNSERAEAARRGAAQARAESAQTIRDLFVQNEELLLRKRAAARAGSGRAQGSGQGTLTQSQLEALKDLGMLDAEGAKALSAMRGVDMKVPKSTTLSEGEKKVQRLMAGVAPAAQTIREAVATGAEVPHPYYSKILPDAVRGRDAVQLERSMSAMSDILLRDESGAAIGVEEKEKKLDGWGIYSSDPEVRREGLRRMLVEFEARSSVGAAQPEQSSQPVVRHPGTTVQRAIRFKPDGAR